MKIKPYVFQTCTKTEITKCMAICIKVEIKHDVLRVKLNGITYQ